MKYEVWEWRQGVPHHRLVTRYSAERAWEDAYRLNKLREAIAKSDIFVEYKVKEVNTDAEYGVS